MPPLKTNTAAWLRARCSQQKRPLMAFLRSSCPGEGRESFPPRRGVAHAISPDVRSGHPVLHSLDGNFASPSRLRSVSNAARLAWATPLTRLIHKAVPAGCRAAAVTNLWLRARCSQQKRPWMAFLRSSCPGRMPGSSGHEPLASCPLLTAKTATEGVFAIKLSRQDAGRWRAEPLAFHSPPTAKTARRAFLRSSQYRGTGAGVERAGGTAFGSEKGHQLPLVVCCWGIWLLYCWAWALTLF
jgi:hypothetical protein